MSFLVGHRSCQPVVVFIEFHGDMLTCSKCMFIYHALIFHQKVWYILKETQKSLITVMCISIRSQIFNTHYDYE